MSELSLRVYARIDPRNGRISVQKINFQKNKNILKIKKDFSIFLRILSYEYKNSRREAAF